MSDTPELVPAEGYLLAALRGLAEGMPAIEGAVAAASKGASEGAPDRVEGLVEQVLNSAGRGEPSRTRAIAALPPEQVTAAVREAASRLGEADRERLTAAAADLDANPDGERTEAFLDAASQVLADAPSVRHTLLTYAQVHLGRGKPLAAGERIGSRFEVIEFLGEGGTGAVYRVMDHRRGKEVALKLLSRALVESPAARERFRKEVNLALDMTHPNVIRVFDMDEVDGQPFLHMELIEGDTLRALVAEGPLPFDRAMSIARGFLGALAYAHGKGVLHLDVKPENILLGKGGEVKLADFGLARAMSAEGMRTLMAGAGTPYYMSPEQLKGEDGLDARADVFASGAVLYEMLVGDPPIGVFEPIPETVPSTVRAAVQQALSHRKEKRPRDARELLALIDAPAAQIPVARLVEEESPRPAPRRVRPVASPFRRRRGGRPSTERRGPVAVGKNEAGLDVFENSVGMRLVALPPGEFTMGSDDGEADERPAHRVVLTRPLLLGETPVTQAQYQAVMGTAACRFRGALMPVENVSWSGAILFLRSLGRREGTLYGLPSEAEWEYACRAGTQSRWFWGDDPLLADAHAWVADNSGGSTHNVKEKRPNAWGLYDMIGNISEWCADWYDEEGYSGCNPPRIDPEGPSTGANRVVRGGSWSSFVQDLGSARRSMEMPSSRNRHIGFRVAMPTT